MFNKTQLNKANAVSLAILLCVAIFATCFVAPLTALEFDPNQIHLTAQLKLDQIDANIGMLFDCWVF